MPIVNRLLYRLSTIYTNFINDIYAYHIHNAISSRTSIATPIIVDITAAKFNFLFVENILSPVIALAISTAFFLKYQGVDDFYLRLQIIESYQNIHFLYTLFR